MKKYAVFAKKTVGAQAQNDTTIWHFLNDTNVLEEATYWYLHAKQKSDTYTEVQIVEPVKLQIISHTNV